MSSEIENANPSGIASLVSGIVDDMQKLTAQHFQMLQWEVKSDFQKTKEAGLYLASGVTLCLPAIILLSLMLVHLLHASTSPQDVDPAGIPMWACYGIIAGLFTLPGVILGYIGVRKFQSFNPLPDETANLLMGTSARVVSGRS